MMMMAPVTARHEIERLGSIPFAASAGLRGVEVFDLDFRVGMHGGDDRFLILSPHDDVITQANHCPIPRG